jgi:predicted DNA-binding transcriptional regulator YafY
MKRSIRLYLLVQRLGGGRAWRPEEIADHFRISVRTAYRDLADLSSAHSIPVTTDDEGRYRLVEGATMRLLPLTATERAILTRPWTIRRSGRPPTSTPPSTGSATS